MVWHLLGTCLAPARTWANIKSLPTQTSSTNVNKFKLKQKTILSRKYRQQNGGHFFRGPDVLYIINVIKLSLYGLSNGVYGQ